MCLENERLALLLVLDARLGQSSEVPVFVLSPSQISRSGFAFVPPLRRVSTPVCV